MKYSILLLILSVFANANSQNNLKIESALNYQISENKKFATAETTILTTKDFKNFEALNFFPIDTTYVVEAKFVRTLNEQPFLMVTTTDRLPEYVKYGEVYFQIKDKNYKLNLYQNTIPSKDPKYIDYLFLPFTDLTNGEKTYGGGRFLDAKIPKGDTMVLDFNKAYNPYCAYNSKYSCPIPPIENHLNIEIKAGVMAYSKH